jgi:hypothetical protein
MSTGNRFNLPPPPSTPQRAPWTDAQLANSYLYAILQALQPAAAGGGGGATLNDVVAALNSILAIMQNAPAIQTLDVPVTAPNQQLQFTTLIIPDGFPLTIQSHPDNNPTGQILIAPKNGNLQFNVVVLKPGQFAQYRVTSSDALYITGTVEGDTVIFSSEVK